MIDRGEVDAPALDLVGRVAVVTGSARGLGAGIAEYLERCHARVVRLDVIDDSLGDWIPCDVADIGAVAEAAAQVKESHGGCDLLVNNAGIVRSAPLEDVTTDDWRQVTEVNLGGTFNCMREFGRLMLEAGGGSIVNISSIAALTPSPGRGAYSATKGGLLSLTRQAALEWGPRGVRCNAICPGLLDVRMDKIEPAESTESATRSKARLVPLGRLGNADDVASLVAFLGSDLAAYLNGATIGLDGGLSQAILHQLHEH